MVGGRDLRESIGFSWTVVIGPNSGRLGLRRRCESLSLDTNRRPLAGGGISVSLIPPGAIDDGNGSSMLFGTAVEGCISFADRNVRWFRGSVT